MVELLDLSGSHPPLRVCARRIGEPFWANSVKYFCVFPFVHSIEYEFGVQNKFGF
jgi:hypothetical protein